MKLLNLKNILLSLILALCSVNVAMAVTVDEITPETIVTLQCCEISNALYEFHGDAKIKAARQIAKSITRETIAKVNQGNLSDLLLADPSLAKQFALLIDKEMITKVDCSFIWYLLREDKSLAKDFVKLIDKEMFITGRYAKLIEDIIKADEGLVYCFTHFIDKETIVKIDSRSFAVILTADPSLAKEYVKFIDKDTIVKAKSGVIEVLLMSDASLVNEIARLIDEETISQLNFFIITLLVALNQNLEKDFIKLIDENNFLNISSTLLIVFAQKHEDFRKKLENMVNEKLENIDFENHQKLDFVLFSTKQVVNLYTLLTQLNLAVPKFAKSKWQQSYQHLEHVVIPSDNGRLGSTFKKLGKNTAASLTLFNIVKQEFLEQEKGRYTAIHSQKNDWWVRSMIFKRILDLKYQQKISELYYPLRFTQLGMNVSEEHRAEIMKNGGDESKKELLFMNPTITSSTFRGGHMGSSSLNFFVNNRDWSRAQITIQDLFKTYDFDSYCKPYAQEFAALEKEALQDDYGTMLLLSFSPEQLEKSVYSGQGGGKKKEIRINGKGTTSAKEILDALRYAPEAIHSEDFDHIELCMALCDDTQTGVIHPFSKDSVHIYWYRVKDMSDWLKKLDALFVKIKKDIEFDRQQKLQPQISHNKTCATLDSVAQRRLAVLGKQIQDMK